MSAVSSSPAPSPAPPAPSTTAPSSSSTPGTRRPSPSLPLRPPKGYAFLSLKWRRANADMHYKEVEKAIKTKLRQDISLKGDNIKKVYEYAVGREDDLGSWGFRFIVEIESKVFTEIEQAVNEAKSTNLSLCTPSEAYHPPTPPPTPSPPPMDLPPSPLPAPPPAKKPRRAPGPRKPKAPPSSAHLLPPPPITQPSVLAAPLPEPPNTFPSLPPTTFPHAPGRRSSSVTVPPLMYSGFPVQLPLPVLPLITDDLAHPWELKFDNVDPPDCPIFDQIRLSPSRPRRMLAYVNDDWGSDEGAGTSGSGGTEEGSEEPVTPVTPMPLGARGGEREEDERAKLAPHFPNSNANAHQHAFHPHPLQQQQHQAAAHRLPSLPALPSVLPPSSSSASTSYTPTLRPPPLPDLPAIHASSSRPPPAVPSVLRIPPSPPSTFLPSHSCPLPVPAPSGEEVFRPAMMIEKPPGKRGKKRKSGEGSEGGEEGVGAWASAGEYGAE